MMMILVLGAQRRGSLIWCLASNTVLGWRLKLSGSRHSFIPSAGGRSAVALSVDGDLCKLCVDNIGILVPVVNAHPHLHKHI